MVTTGLEPATLGLLDQCSTNWAKRPVHWSIQWTEFTSMNHALNKKYTLGGDRTHDHKIKSLALYHLSYEGSSVKGTNFVIDILIIRKNAKNCAIRESNPGHLVGNEVS